VALQLAPRSAPARADEMLQALRFRICSEDPETSIMLHEGKLAHEFGVSRTPIRQVLQRLAFEHLLETRSGIGTVVSPLQPAERALHFAMLADMLRLCRRCAAPTLDVPSRVLAGTIAGIARSRGTDLEGSYFEIRTQMLDLASGLLRDPIASEAHAAMHWRVIRWRMQAARDDAAAAFAELEPTLAALERAATPGDVLDCLAAEKPLDRRSRR
jgi:DNA-binding GntR family transcriptional regulator